MGRVTAPIADKPEKLNMHLQLINISSDLSKIRSIWEPLSEQADAPYFLSWGWVENWLTGLPEALWPRLAVLTVKQEAIGAFFISTAEIVRHYLFKSRGLHVNATGRTQYDGIWIEYNRILLRPFTEITWSDIFSQLPEPWDECYFAGIDTDTFPGNSLHQLPGSYGLVVEDSAPSPFVDLEMVRKNGGDYLSLLSANTRAQIRRAYRLYAKQGPVILEAASELGQAIEFFDELMLRHQKTWQARGAASAFASAYVAAFHRRLINSRFNFGEIQLLRIRAGDETIGCLYNLSYRKQVFFYQSGMSYKADKRLKPGLISHVEAIKYNAAQENSRYDFLGGFARYKNSLATGANQLMWVRIQRPRMRFKLENKLKALSAAWRRPGEKG